jgi:hypothetical protein
MVEESVAGGLRYSGELKDVVSNYELVEMHHRIPGIAIEPLSTAEVTIAKTAAIPLQTEALSTGLDANRWTLRTFAGILCSGRDRTCRQALHFLDI